jgi:peptide/nickel transport system permease protein
MRGLALLRFVLRRLAVAVPLALAAATLVFVLMETAPGTPADLMLGDRPVPPEVRERLLEVHGFDLPPHERYLRWLDSLVLQGDLGWSHSRSRPVGELLAAAFPATLLLAFSALVVHLLVGVALGSLSAAGRGGWLDRALTTGSLVVYAMPVFWIGLMAVLLLSYRFPVFPASSMSSVGAEGWTWSARTLDVLWHLALPAGVLGLASAAVTMRFVRAGVLQALGQGFTRAARARGAGRSRVLVRHALRNSLLAVINLVGLSLPALLSGSLVVEVVFAWPGMGRLTFEAIQAQDFPVVLATTLLATLLVVLGSLAADLAMAAADPRVRLEPVGALS